LLVCAAALSAAIFAAPFDAAFNHALADKPARPSFKDVLAESSPDAEDVALATQKLIETGRTGRITLEEIEEKIVIRWRGPKKNDLFGESVKARAKSAAGFHIYKSKNRYMNFVLLAAIDADSSGYYKYEDFDLKNDEVYFYKITLVDSDGGDNYLLPQFQRRRRQLFTAAVPGRGARREQALPSRKA